MTALAWESKNWQNLNDIDQKAVDNFREYLKIPSVHPNIDYEPCVKFLERIAQDIGLQFSVYRTVPKNPVVVLTWVGTDRALPSILLNSHMDAVPVFEDKWKYKPFGAEIDNNGNIYGRGAQDDKCFGVQYPEAIRRLKLAGFSPKRTVHVLYVPDEETGGFNGMKSFVLSDDFKKLNVGFGMDEGEVSGDGTVTAYYGEKRSWSESGHGSLLLNGTTGEKFQYVLSKMYQFRKIQKERNEDNVITINLTMLTGGVQVNVIPATLSMAFDVRSPVEEFDDFEALVLKWCKELRSGIEIETYLKDDVVENTKVDETNPFWVAFKSSVEKLGIIVKTKISPANSDGQSLRALGIPVLVFSPSRYSPKTSHSDDEFLNINVFLDGITIYKEIIANLTNV